MTTIHIPHDAPVIDSHLDARVARIEVLLDELVGASRDRAATVDSISADLQPILRMAFGSVVEKAGRLDEQGYVEFGREVVGILDRVVSNYSAEDVRALGDNIVVLLDALREMTQPEVVGLIRRTVHVVGDRSEERPPPPTMVGLLRELREPSVRQGLDRLVDILRSMGDPPAAATTPQPQEAKR